MTSRPFLVVDNVEVPAAVIDPPLRPTIKIPAPIRAPGVVVPAPGPIGPPGPQGDVGPAGPAFSGKAIWYGNGEPDVVIGSKPGDSYIDLDTGTVYELT